MFKRLKKFKKKINMPAGHILPKNRRLAHDGQFSI